VSGTAREVGLSLKRLLHGFKEIYGETPAQLLRHERLLLARRLVEEGQLPLKEVAWRVGYHHVTNFVNAFSAEYGVPPGGWGGNGPPLRRAARRPNVWRRSRRSRPPAQGAFLHGIGEGRASFTGSRSKVATG